MTIREVPRAFEYTCDHCGQKHLQENATGHYSNSQPPGWSTLKFKSVLVQHRDLEKLLCEHCGSRMLMVIERELNEA